MSRGKLCREKRMRMKRNKFEGDAERTGSLAPLSALHLTEECDLMVEELNIFSVSSKTNGNRILELEEEAASNRENVQKLQGELMACT